MKVYVGFWRWWRLVGVKHIRVRVWVRVSARAYHMLQTADAPGRVALAVDVCRLVSKCADGRPGPRGNGAYGA